MDIPTTNPPSPETADASREALEKLEPLRGAQHIVFKAPGHDALAVELPAEAYVLLEKILGYLAQGEALTVLPLQAELTTQQAADLLQVSRPFLVQLLEGGEIPFHKVGSHRRVRAADLLEYKRRDDQERESIADELTAQAQELGLGY